MPTFQLNGCVVAHISIGRFDQLAVTQAAAWDIDLRRQLCLPPVLASTDAQLPARGKVELVGCVQAFVVRRELI